MAISLQDHPEQMLICVGPNGEQLGKTVNRMLAHTTPGVKHLAIQILVFNSKKELILHERPIKKVGGGVLDAPTTHVLSGENPIESAYRCLKTEYGIVERPELKIYQGYSYESDYGDGSCENEFCIAAYIIYDGEINPSKEEMSKIAVIPAKKVKEEIILKPRQYPPWLQKSIEVIETHNKDLFR